MLIIDLNYSVNPHFPINDRAQCVHDRVAFGLIGKEGRESVL